MIRLIVDFVRFWAKWLGVAVIALVVFLLYQACQSGDPLDESDTSMPAAVVAVQPASVHA